MHERRRPDGRLPLTIVGGFLGAGKSTWLRHQLHAGALGRVHLIVNEAAQTPVDNLLLGKAARIDVLAGGCACCEGREALISALRAIFTAHDAGQGGDIEHIVLETSGLADPKAIAIALSRDPMLARRLVVECVVVLVDALHGPAQLGQEQLNRQQIEAAEQIVITKVLDVTPANLSRLKRTLHLINPGASIVGAERGVPFDLPPVGSAAPYSLPDICGSFPDAIRAYRLDIAGGGGWANFSVWLSALLAARGDNIVRVKGVVTSPEGRLLIQSVCRTVQQPEILPNRQETENGPPPEEDIIVLIGRGMDESLLMRSWRRFVS